MPFRWISCTPSKKGNLQNEGPMKSNQIGGQKKKEKEKKISNYKGTQMSLPRADQCH